jgi:hypothetical protein
MQPSQRVEIRDAVAALLVAALSDLAERDGAPEIGAMPDLRNWWRYGQESFVALRPNAWHMALAVSPRRRAHLPVRPLKYWVRWWRIPPNSVTRSPPWPLLRSRSAAGSRDTSLPGASSASSPAGGCSHPHRQDDQQATAGDRVPPNVDANGTEIRTPRMRRGRGSSQT